MSYKREPGVLEKNNGNNKNRMKRLLLRLKKKNNFLRGGWEAAANQSLFSEKPGSSPRFSSLSSTNPHLFWVIQSPGKQRFLIGLKMPSRKTSQSCLEVRTVLWRHYNHCMARMCTNLSVPQISDPSSKGSCRKEDFSKPTLSVILHLHFFKLLSLSEREKIKVKIPRSNQKSLRNKLPRVGWLTLRKTAFQRDLSRVGTSAGLKEGVSRDQSCRGGGWYGRWSKRHRYQ